jgi:hypothetical protein
MEPSYFTRFIQFVKSSFQEKFKAFMPGCIMGYIGGQHVLFSGITISMVEYGIKFIGATAMAFSSGLATAYAAHLVDKYKNKNNEQPKRRRRKGDKAA